MYPGRFEVRRGCLKGRQAQTLAYHSYSTQNACNSVIGVILLCVVNTVSGKAEEVEHFTFPSRKVGFFPGLAILTSVRGEKRVEHITYQNGIDRSSCEQNQYPDLYSESLEQSVRLVRKAPIREGALRYKHKQTNRVTYDPSRRQLSSEPLDCHKSPNFTLDSRKMGGEGKLPSQQKQLVEGFDSHGAVLVHSFNRNTGFVFLNPSAGSGSIVLSSAMSFTDT